MMGIYDGREKPLKREKSLLISSWEVKDDKL